MMKKHSSRSSIFLIEIIVAILCFALVSAVCLQIFVQSKRVSEDSVNLNNAVLAVSSVCEIFDAAQDIDHAVDNLAEVYRKQDFQYSAADRTGSYIPHGASTLILKFVISEPDINGITSVNIRVIDPGAALDVSELTTGAVPEHAVYELNKEVYYGQ